MKEKLKYLIALLLLGSVGMLFMPLVKISIVEFSFMGIMKIGLGNYNTNGISGEIAPFVHRYFESDVILFACFVTLILAGAFITAIIKGKKAYIAAIVSCVVNSLAALYICLYSKEKIIKVKSTIYFMGMDQYPKLSYSTIILWVISYIVIIALCIVGIALWKTDKFPETTQIMLEKFDLGKDSYESIVNLEERDMFDERPMGEAENKLEQTSPEYIDYGKESSNYRISDFNGVILGKVGFFEGMAFPLKEREEVFFYRKEGVVLIRDKGKIEDLAGVYYVSEYQEYRINVLKQETVFLDSGQPLGKGRQYYLPRGSEIYITNRENQFILA